MQLLLTILLYFYWLWTDLKLAFLHLIRLRASGTRVFPSSFESSCDKPRGCKTTNESTVAFFLMNGTIWNENQLPKHLYYIQSQLLRDIYKASEEHPITALASCPPTHTHTESRTCWSELKLCVCVCWDAAPPRSSRLLAVSRRPAGWSSQLWPKHKGPASPPIGQTERRGRGMKGRTVEGRGQALNSWLDSCLLPRSLSAAECSGDLPPIVETVSEQRAGFSFLLGD